jgi:CheY-like chemotaxis protein
LSDAEEPAMIVVRSGVRMATAGKVLIVEDDTVLGDLVHAILVDEGYTASVLGAPLLGRAAPDALRAAVGRLEPDCVLLDSGGRGAYDTSWAEAAWLHQRARPVPVVMFTADAGSTKEARASESARSRAAGFFAVLDKPFDLDELLATVARAVGQAVPFDASPAAEAARTAALVAKLEAAGARDVRPGARREWASFGVPDGACVQLYWRPRDGTYHVVRCAAPGRALERVGRVPDLDAAVALAMTVHRAP